MAFGQTSGPPATGKQVNTLMELLNDAGHVDFRDARGPMGFTQRQAGGKFTRDEADTFIAQLEAAQESGEAIVATPRAARVTKAQKLLERVSDNELAAELQRRGWAVMKP